MPVRSTGCGNCVRRKIRCDRRPGGCKRCEIHRVPCPGYRPEVGNGFVFLDMNAYTQSEANKNYARIQHKQSVERINYSVDTLWQIAAGVTGGISSANVQRVALRNEFLQSYLPRQNAHSSSSPNPLSFMEILTFQTSGQRNTALQPAMDALGLVQLGSIAKDERLLKSSVDLYGKALSRLAVDLQREDLRRNDDVLASTIVLSICELYEEIAQNNGGWVKHIDGTNGILKIRGPRNVKSDLALALYTNARNSALVQGLMSRKASYMATPEWRSVGKSHHFIAPAAIFYDAAIQVPGLLERSDLLQEGIAPSAHDIDDLLNDITMLDARLRGWFGGWEASTAVHGHQLKMSRPVSHFTYFSTRCADRTLHRAYHFPSFHVGYMHSLFWMCVHELRTCVQQLAGIRKRIDPQWAPTAHCEVAEDELQDYILDLCRCIPFFCEPLSGSIGHIAIFLPMRIAAAYFGTRRQSAWLKWIGAVKATVFTQGLSPPLVGRPKFMMNLPTPAQSSGGSSPKDASEYDGPSSG